MKTRIVPIVAGVALLYFLVMGLEIEIQLGSGKWVSLGGGLIVAGITSGLLAYGIDKFIASRISKIRKKLEVVLREYDRGEKVDIDEGHIETDKS